MPASTNIPISATTTDFVGAIEAARAAVASFDRDLNTKLTNSFRALDREQRTYAQGLGRVQRQLAEQAAEAARSAAAAQAAAAKRIADIGSGFRSVGQGLSTYITLPLLAVGGAAYNAYANIDSMIKGLKVVAGSTEGATKQFKEFYALSQKPGLGLEQTVAAGLQLKTLGYQARTAQKYVAEVGNAIALGGKGKVEFGQVITQFTQMAGKAKVLGDDLKPIINASPVIAKAILDMFGSVDSEQISKKLQALGKGPKDFIASLVTELAKLERVGTGPKTAMENFGDAATIAGFQIGKAADETFGLTDKLNRLGNLLGSTATAFGESSAAVKLTTFTVLGAAAAFGPLSLAIGVAIKGYQALTLETSAFRVGLAALTSPTAITIAAAAAIALVGYAAYKAGQPVVELADKMKILASINDTATQSLTAEAVELEHLYKVAKDETRSKEEREKAIRALNQLSPEYLGFLNQENINSQKAADAIYKQGQAIVFRAKARAAEEQLTELARKRFEIEQKPVTDFERPLLGSIKYDPLSGRMQAFTRSKDEIRTQAQQFKNEALESYDKAINEVEGYLSQNKRRASRRGIVIDAELTPTFNFKGAGSESAFDKLKDEAEAAQQRIRDFVAKNGSKVKVPVDLQLDYKNKAAAVKAAEDAVKDISPKAPKTVSVKTDSQYGALALNKRIADRLAREIQDAGGKGVDEKINQLQLVRSEIERLEALTSKTQKADILGISEIVNPNFNDSLKKALASFTYLSAVTPALFAKTGVKDFLTDIQQSAPSLDFLKAKIEEIRATIATVTLSGVKVPPELLEALKALKKLLADATNATGAADAATETGDGNNSKWVAKAQKRIDAMKAAGKETKFTAEQLGAEMKAAAMGFAQASFAALESIGTALGSGGDPLKAALQSITDALGNYLIKQGEALALAALFSETAAVTAGPFAALLSIPVGFQLAAAGVMIAGGAAVKAIGSYAKGGVFTQPTLGLFGEYAGAGSGNPEIATPQRLMASTFQDVLRANDTFNQLRTAYAGRPSTQRIEVTVSGRARGKDIHFSGTRTVDSLASYS